MNYIINAYAMQDIGLRRNQEDCFFPPFIDPCHYDETQRDWCYYDGSPHTDQRLFIVCDGMGGHDRGEVASRIVCQTMSQTLLKEATIEGAFNDSMIHQAVDKALEALTEEDNPNEVKKMGTTMALLKFHAQGATIAHIGDTRVYQFRPATSGRPPQVMFCTKDHTVVNDMVQRGQISYAQAKVSNRKHILSRSMMSQQGYHPVAEIDHITDIQPGDIFMLCTDGVFENLDHQNLCDIVTDPNYSDVELTQRLLHECLHNRDNHTAYIVRVKDVLNVEGKTAPDSSLPAGTVLKSENYTYQIEKVLGQGAFGITYLVNTIVSMQGQLGTIRTGVKVALKEFFMHKEMKREGGELIEISPDSKVKIYAEKFRKEAQKLASLTHPNIVRVLEVFEANNTIYYSMEYLPGGSLNDYVNKRDGLPEREAIKCIRQIGSALLYLHTNKMLHLDVKPSNIMRSDTTGALKLIDFGLAKRYVDNGDPESSASLGSGTTGYAPLEQADASNEMEFSPSIDVYALGATYYKLLTAHVPDSAVDVLNSGLSTMPLVKKNVSQKSIDAIKAAMEPLKAKRLPNVQEFLDMLPRVDDDTIFYEKKERKLKKRWLVALLLTVLILLPSAYFLFFVKRKNTPLQVAAFEKALNMEMVRVEGGTFMMGSDSVSDPMADTDERPLRKVALSTFYIGRYEVTLRQWDAVMRHTTDGSSKNADFPVHNITWDDVERFIDRLNEETGREYRLPTEAEWEYAARGGRHAEKYAYSGGKQPGPVAWFAENSNRTVHRVGGLQPNALGLYDMSGNVWELCSDYYGPYDTLDVKDPQGPERGVYHVMRGGSCNSSPQSCRVTFRQDNSLMSGDAVVGFRLVLPAEDR
ncbi:MAG: SUMF1/EgtB/PvdO family nonheme iron enzyme [Bacteroidales bacterium]|nr:SUMF1/EgtB/PvdO family nonheme iron enzyme [Bacteroidales bacterium]